MPRKIFALALVVLSGAAHVPAQTAVVNSSIAQSTNTAAQPESAAVQQPSPTPNPLFTPAQESVDDVVRITSKLVQLDLVVMDKSGKQVTDLKAEDFEVFEDGHAQPVTHFSYVYTGPTSGPSTTKASTATADSGTNPMAPRREHVRRTIALVVDDLGMSFVTTITARKALKKFINEQIQPGDLVAIIRTGGEVGALQQFTNDKRLLLAAVERVRWNSCSRRGINVLAAEGHAFHSPLCAFQSAHVSVAALGAVITGMQELPGRKSLIFFADGFPLPEPGPGPAATFGLADPTRPAMVNGIPRAGNIDSSFAMLRDSKPGMYFDPVNMLSEMAIRASVVVYSVDTRGLATLSINANDEVGGLSGQGVNLLLDRRSTQNHEGRPESAKLAETTGGFFIQNTNNLNPGLNQIMEDQRGYYLIGYRPGGETFDRRFHRLSARLKTRSDLTVRTRAGFYGLTDEDARPVKRTAVDRFQLALMSPFGASDIDVRLRPLFTSLPNLGPTLRSRLRINAQNLSFNEEPGGWRSAQLVLRALLLGDNGRIVDEHRRAFTVRLRGATFERVRSQGFDYVFNMPAKKPGSYQFRIAIIDTVSSRVGSAAQYVEVPNLKNKQLVLSGIAMNEDSGTGVDSGPTPATLDAAGPLKPRDVGANAGARRFQRNTSLSYEYLVFNPGEPTGKRLTTLVQLFHDGKLVLELDSPVEILQPGVASQVLARGRLTLAADLAAGDYVLQITVTDPTAKKGQGIATQSADFEIID
jgi:VWFA-related protein